MRSPFMAGLVLLSACSLDWSQRGAEMDASTRNEAGVDVEARNDAGGGLDAAALEAGPGGALPCADPRTYYADVDGDGFGRPETAKQACEPPQGYAETADDCHDGNRDVHPGAPELCNSVDDDCDGETPDGLAQCNGFRCTDSECLSACDGTEDCVTGLSCQGTTCVGSDPLGAECKGDIYCAAGHCECADASCSVRRCAADACPVCKHVDESGSSCSGGLDAVESRDCLAPNICAAGTCRVDEDGACGSDDQCATGSCSPTQTCQAPQPAGTACNSESDCVDSSCLTGICRMPNDRPCEADIACVSGSCLQICRDPGPLDAACDTDPDCQAALQCTAHVCKLRNGQTCGADGACASGTCLSVCRAERSSQGQSCDSGPDCVAGTICSSGTCRFPDGASCTDDTTCASKSCAPDGKCHPPRAYGESCNSNPDCVAGLSCGAGVCKRSNGVDCSADSDCASGACPPSKKCAQPGQLNASCDSKEDCSGSCLVCPTLGPAAGLCKAGFNCPCDGDDQCITEYCESTSSGYRCR